MSACLHDVGKQPVCKEWFTMAVSTGASAGRCCFSIQVGHGSSCDDFVGDFVTTAITSSVVIGVNAERDVSHCVSLNSARSEVFCPSLKSVWMLLKHVITFFTDIYAHLYHRAKQAS